VARQESRPRRDNRRQQPRVVSRRSRRHRRAREIGRRRIRCLSFACRTRAGRNGTVNLFCHAQPGRGRRNITHLVRAASSRCRYVLSGEKRRACGGRCYAVVCRRRAGRHASECAVVGGSAVPGLQSQREFRVQKWRAHTQVWCCRVCGNVSLRNEPLKRAGRSVV